MMFRDGKTAYRLDTNSVPYSLVSLASLYGYASAAMHLRKSISPATRDIVGHTFRDNRPVPAFLAGLWPIVRGDPEPSGPAASLSVRSCRLLTRRLLCQER